MPLDPRLTPARPDLASAALKGQVEAARYVEGDLRRVAVPVAPLRRRPASDAPLETQALFGETVRVFEDDPEGWSWVQLEADRYVGYLPTEALAAPGTAPTHTVRALRTFLFPGPDIKLPPREALVLGSKVAVREVRGGFAVTPDGFLPIVHLAEPAEREGDFVAVAARFLGVPYLWGGRSSLGLDCSGLVQTALAAAGVAAPRDSDMQEAALGKALPLDAEPRRGDLLFWPGHVGIVEAADTLLHANAFHMAVAREPLAEALTRIAAAGLALRSIRRLA
ncbi:UNVERIFIED_ORG: cell wall-associated NlpC family hydrolase [Xanthobacter viscosus]|uniref:NlpC/P60 family protein n=1 Tax=Xanthobacter autotrophicus TaxID=280 RepID=A0A6C1KD52_XANAU|nr:NlpC/P60 family protein [Xanthobacter autotrophicus]TLX42208.1 NlpC/P60 family protein [Xanthobacter autotrophicus]